MPYLKINACVDCPHSGSDNRIAYGMDDMFGIKCTHPDQTNDGTFLAKIKNKDNRIYFDCPLDTDNREDSDDY